MLRCTKKHLTRGRTDPRMCLCGAAKAHPGRAAPNDIFGRQTVYPRGNAMYNATEQFAELNKTNVEQATKLAAVALQNAEKLFNANLEAAKYALAHGAEGAA